MDVIFFLNTLLRNRLQIKTHVKLHPPSDCARLFVTFTKILKNKYTEKQF